jgi:NADPH:quinone reductase-like Zn-dependent oxidoreductase
VTRVLSAVVLSLFGNRKLRPFLAKFSNADLVTLKELIDAGKLTPVVDRTYPLSQAAEAVRYVETKHAQAKVVITV